MVGYYGVGSVWEANPGQHVDASAFDSVSVAGGVMLTTHPRIMVRLMPNVPATIALHVPGQYVVAQAGQQWILS
jgi:hypothetical protein